jgi:hypothetical protein
MPNQTPSPLRPYLTPFVADHFYLIPLPWLRAVAGAADLDARELLLAQVVDGQVIFTEEEGEQHWHGVDGAVRPFFTRRTYERHRQRLLADGLLRRAPAAPRPANVTRAAWQDLRRGIKYLVEEWPAAAWLYRPRTYLENRWPVWLGNSDVTSRLILLALLAEAERLARTPDARLPEQTSLNWRQLYTVVEEWFGAAAITPPANGLAAALRKGIYELLALGALREEAGADQRYVLHLNVFDRNPQWSLAGMAQRCQADPVQDGALLELVRELMTHCCEPVTRLKRVWNAVQAQRQSATLLDESDLLDLQKFIRTQRKGGPPRHNHLLQAFLRQRQATGRRLVSAIFRLSAHEVALAAATVHGAPLYMPAVDTHGLAATQLWVHCERRDGLTVEQAQVILAASHWLVWQEGTGGPPVLIVLAGPPPRPLSIDFGYVLRANDLHGRLDYARPFEVLLRCRQPDPRLILHCRFRLLYPVGRK